MIYLQVPEYHVATIAQENRFFPQLIYSAKGFPSPDLPLPSSSPRFSGSPDFYPRSCVFSEPVSVPCCCATFPAILNGFASCDQTYDRGSIYCCYPRT